MANATAAPNGHAAWALASLARVPLGRARLGRRYAQRAALRLSVKPEAYRKQTTYTLCN
jgi:hypothetical protein